MAKGRFVKKMMPATTTNYNQAIVNFLLSEGHSASRVNTTGVWDEEKQAWRRSGGRSGFFDIVACLSPWGKYFTVDTKRKYKRGKDKASDEQKKYKAEVEDAGGIAIYAKDYQDFLNQYYSILLDLCK